jgi:uncharacterized protein YodC (DUF2158 family)
LDAGEETSCEIAAGSAVQPKSGGLLMTVRKVDGQNGYCDWFSKEKVFSKTFELSQLIPDNRHIQVRADLEKRYEAIAKSPNSSREND